MKRVKQHKKVGSDGIADLKKLYQVERQQQAEIFLLDFISSDEASDPVTKGTLSFSLVLVSCILFKHYIFPLIFSHFFLFFLFLILFCSTFNSEMFKSMAIWNGLNE